MRQLILVDEGLGAFRLPVASFEGLAGVEVRDEPFCLPTNMGEHEVSFPIGIMLDRGVKTQLPWAVPVEALHTFALMLGEKGKARTSVLHAILQGASTVDIPWVLIRNAHSDRASLLQGLSVDHFILGTQAQLQDIQLFSPPPGVLLPTFIDALLLIFSVTCKLEPASATLLRKALIEVYEKYKVQSGYQITLPDLIVGLEQILQRITAPATLRDCAKTTPAILKGSDGTPDREIISAWPLSNVLLTRVSLYYRSLLWLLRRCLLPHLDHRGSGQQCLL